MARLDLGDIDWRAGELTIHGKGRRDDILPLPDDIGAAMAEYVVHARPATTARSVRHPGRPVQSDGHLNGHGDGRSPLRPGRSGQVRATRNAARRRLRVTRRRGIDGGNRPVAAARAAAHHRDLRQARPSQADRVGPALPAGGRARNMRMQAEQYLASADPSGYQLRAEGRMLLDFADRLDASGQRTITIATAMAWACEPITSTMQHQCRLRVVRGFARHVSALIRTVRYRRPICWWPSAPPDAIPVLAGGDRGTDPRRRHHHRTAAGRHNAGPDSSHRGQRHPAG